MDAMCVVKRELTKHTKDTAFLELASKAVCASTHVHYGSFVYTAN